MKTRGALLWGVDEPWSVDEIEIDDPRRDEVTVRLEAAGLCRSDHHLTTGALPASGTPILGGHEGAGVVVAVGADVDDLAVGQHVVLACVPSCGQCSWCQAGHPNLCERAGSMHSGRSISDSSFRIRAKGHDVSAVSLLGAFSPYAVVHRASVVPVDPAVPFEVACLLGCAVATGWGAVTRSARVRPGDDVVVIGAGGVGMSAVLAAVVAGARRIIVVEPLEWKRDRALKSGATHAYPDTATAIMEVAALTGGFMAHRVIVAVGEPLGKDLDSWMILTGKGGRCVLAAIADTRSFDVTVHLALQVLMQKRLQGIVNSGGDLRHDVALLAAMYRVGRLDLDGLVTKSYRLDDINDGFRDMLAGNVIRGVIRYTEADWVL